MGAWGGDRFELHVKTVQRKVHLGFSRAKTAWLSMTHLWRGEGLLYTNKRSRLIDLVAVAGLFMAGGARSLE